MDVDVLLKVVEWERRYKETGDPYTVIQLMQELIDTGEIHLLDAKFLDMANRFIECRFCTRPKLKVVK